MNTSSQSIQSSIHGELKMPDQWKVFGPIPLDWPLPKDQALVHVPSQISHEGKAVLPLAVTPTRGQYVFTPVLGEPPYAVAHAVLIYIPLHSPSAQLVSLGLGADWFMQAWVNGQLLVDTMKEGNLSWPASIHDFQVNAHLEQGDNLLVVRVIHGKVGGLLAVGGPDELRRNDFESILPKPPKKDLAYLQSQFPPQPEAPIRWQVPEGFDPTIAGLGLPVLEGIRHFEVMNCLKSTSPQDEGGSGIYESVMHGTWNHNLRIATYQDWVFGIWDNHTLDENGPGSRVLAGVGKSINARGDIRWADHPIIELAPQPIPVMRRKIHCDRDAFRTTAARGSLVTIEGRLFFIGNLGGLYGTTTHPHMGLWSAEPNNPQPSPPIPTEYFHFGPEPGAMNGKFARWNLGVHFYQEWAVRDDRLTPISPLFVSGRPPMFLQITPDLKLPVEPVIEPYKSAPLLSQAPQDFQDLILHGQRVGDIRSPKYAPQTERLTHDGTNGLAHRTQYRRPDGKYVAIRENLSPTQCPFYYAALKETAEDNFPPAWRSNLYGAVNPSAMELPDGSVVIVANSPNRQNMFMVHSRNGITFDRTWLLKHQQLNNYTPGIMKREGGPGAGPQYFVTAIMGQSLWIIYSISKEHIGATQVPLNSLIS